MPLRRAHPIAFKPHGCSDAVDGTNAFEGAMGQLANLVPDPNTRDVFVPRPAAITNATFAAMSAPGFVSSCLVVGNMAYGTIATGRNAGHDEPYVVNLLTGGLLTVANITAGNTPASPPSTGPWTPPILAQVGSKILVTHPGFPGAAIKFGWFDISGANITITGTTTNLSNTIAVAQLPPLLGLGYAITGTGIPPNTYVTAIQSPPFVKQNCTLYNSTIIDIPGGTGGLAVGDSVSGTGVPAATTITQVGFNQIAVNNACTPGSGITLVFGGASILTISNNATASGSTSLTLTGGTTSAPLWGAGDTAVNNLPSVPVGVAQFMGRAYFACGINGLPFSDAGNPTTISNNPFVQALTTSDGLGITAVAPLMLTSPLVSTGIVGALLAFAGTSKIYQITGDPTTSDLAMNPLPVATGTAAPLAVFGCELGTGFVSPEGLRIVQFNGTISPPIGDAGQGITTPFIYSVVPSRMCATANNHCIRISTQNGAVPNMPSQEWWYDIGRQIWTGPMSFPASLIQPWAGPSNTNTFIMTPVGVTGSLWQSDSTPFPNSSYIENSVTLSWAYQPTPLPDTGAMAMNALIEMAFSAALLGGVEQQVFAADIDGTTLDSTQVPIVPILTSAIWDSSLWDNSTWGPTTSSFQQWPVYWTKPLVFKQLIVSFMGMSAYGVRLGNLNMRYQITGYPLPVPRGIAA